MKIKVICATGLLVVAACSKSSDDGKGFKVGDANSYKEVQDLDISKNTSFESQEEIQDGDHSLDQEIYSFGCSQDGQRNNGDKLDPQVRVGDSILSTHYSNDQESHMVSTQLAIIDEIQGDRWNISAKILSTLVEEAGGEVLKKPIEYKFQCEGSDCNPIPGAQPDLNDYVTEKGTRYLPKINSNVRCKMESVEASSKKRDVGVFSLANGKKIRAFRTISRAEGEVSCNGHKLGKGSQSRVSIRSNAVLAMNSWYCGGVEVAGSTTIRLDSKVIESNRLQVQTAKLR